MTEDPLVGEEDFDSAWLKETARTLNLIGRLADRYRAPELLKFLGELARGLANLERRMGRERPHRR